MAKKQNLRVEAIRFAQNGKEIYAFTITPALFAHLPTGFIIDKFEIKNHGRTSTGSQREQIGSKIEDIANYVSNEANIIQTSVSLNCRPDSPDIKFIPMANSLVFGHLEFPSTAIIHVYDGGHRILGLEEAYKANEEMNFPLLGTLVKMTELEEKRQFLISNNEAKPIESGLLQELKLDLYKNGTEAQKRLPKSMKKNMNWLPEANEISRTLNESNSGKFNGNVFYHKMLYAGVAAGGETKNKIPNAEKWIKLNKFNEYIESVVRNKHGLLPDSPQDKAVLLCNLFKALSNLAPEAFGIHAADYFLATSHIGIEPLCQSINSFLIYGYHGSTHQFSSIDDMVDAIPDNDKKKIITVQKFEDILKECKMAPSPRKIYTSAFWKRKDGTAGNYHGKSNIKLLVGFVEQSLNIALPKPARGKSA